MRWLQVLFVALIGALSLSPAAETRGLRIVGPRAGTSSLPAAGGVYHRLPTERNRLAVLTGPITSAEVSRTIERHGGKVDGHRLGGVQIVEFEDHRAMLAAQSQLQNSPGIRRIGPLVSSKPLVLLTDRIAVRFDDVGARMRAQGILSRGGLELARALPYVKHGFVYRRTVADFSIYETARELIEGGHALYAIPVLQAVHDADSERHTAHRFVDGDGDESYLEEMNVFEAWEEVQGRVDRVVLAVFDGGIQGRLWRDVVCPQLRVGVVADFENKNTCLSDTTSWCDSCDDVFSGGSTLDWCTKHATEVGLFAGATHDGGDIPGIAPGVRMINARDWFELKSEPDELFADALWWIAGGDPETGSFPRLGPADRASVINMSFSREYMVEEDCREPGCALVCASDSPCGVIEDCLERLRHPNPEDGVREQGVVVVNSSGTVTNNLAESPNTIAAGSVRFDPDERWCPYDIERAGNPEYPGCGVDADPIHNFGGFVDIVASLGGPDSPVTVCEDCLPCTTGNACEIVCNSDDLIIGASTAAAAAVSGIAALMLEASNDKLSADQVHCILRETAQSRTGPGEDWEDVSEWLSDCAFDDNAHSTCFGRGMVDAGAAVAAARACKSRSRHCPCVELPSQAAKDEPPRADPRSSRGRGRR